MNKKKFIFPTLFIFLIPFSFSLNSCSVSSVDLLVHNRNTMCIKGESIHFSCDFFGINPSDFDCDIIPGRFFKNTYIKQKENWNIQHIKNTISVTIPLTDEIPDVDQTLFTCHGVFFNKDRSIVKQTEEIIVKRDDEEEVINEKCTISFNEVIDWNNVTEINKSDKSSIGFETDQVLDFLNIQPNQYNKYVPEEKDKIKNLFYANFVCFMKMCQQNLRRVQLMDNWGMDIKFGKAEFVVDYAYDLPSKNFIDFECKINAECTTPAFSFVRIPVIVMIHLHDYKIIGVREIKPSEDILMYDFDRKLVGVFFSLAANSEKSYDYSDTTLDFPQPLKYSSIHRTWLNNHSPVALSETDIPTNSKNKVTGVESGVYFPCCNLMGKNFCDAYFIDDNYNHGNQAEEIYDKLLTKNIKEIDLKNVLFNGSSFKFKIKKTLTKNVYDTGNVYTEDTFSLIPEIASLISDSGNAGWKNISVNSIDIPYCSYSSRFAFDFTNPDNPVATFLLNPCFLYDGQVGVKIEGKSHFDFIS